MANKALAKRQKLMIRTEPAQRPLKGRNAVAPNSKQSVNATSSSTGAQSLQQKLLKKLIGGSSH
jgi:hypothetical protein